MNKTNKELGREIGVTSRQISKSRKRGWIWQDGKKKKYTAPEPVFVTLKSVPKRTKSLKAVDERSREFANVR